MNNPTIIKHRVNPITKETTSMEIDMAAFGHWLKHIGQIYIEAAIDVDFGNEEKYKILVEQMALQVFFYEPDRLYTTVFKHGSILEQYRKK